MVAFFELLGRLFAYSLDAVWSSSSPATAIALVGVAGAFGLVALVAAARFGSLVGLSDSLRLVAGLERPGEPADSAMLLSQSDPDADGRPRPRAPGFLLQTA